MIDANHTSSSCFNLAMSDTDHHRLIKHKTDDMILNESSMRSFSKYYLIIALLSSFAFVTGLVASLTQPIDIVFPLILFQTETGLSLFVASFKTTKENFAANYSRFIGLTSITLWLMFATFGSFVPFDSFIVYLANSFAILTAIL